MRIMIKGGVWKNTEDEILKAAVMKYGLNQWARISSLLVRKSAKQCKARWYEWLDPSIKKTEWTREEDEKLLHLAKLMPTQWRTIAPIVGRTPAQCLERYDKLLDMAVAKDERYDPADDPRRLRPGEIDPNPESKPARPDPVDMDEDEKEMLSEARARLANTRGKKAKRKAREKQLEEARRLAALQKKRELKAAGIELRGHRKRRGVDYSAEVAFEKKPAAGFFDTAEEDARARQQAGDFRPVTLEELEGRRRKDIEEALVKRDLKKQRLQDGADAPAAMARAGEEAAGGLPRRGRMMLPAPQVSEVELQQIARLQAAGAGAPELEDGAGGEATRQLLGQYQTPALLPTPARTPRTAGTQDRVMLEAQNLARMQAMQTPLLGGDNPELHPSDFTGATPRAQVAQTPNPLATPALGSGTVRRAIAGVPSTPSIAGTPLHGGMTPAVGGGHVPGATPMRTPMRDELGLNDSTSLVPADGKRAERARQIMMRNELKAGLSQLPAPENEYQVVVPELPEEGDDGAGDMEEDAADAKARRAREEEAQRAAEELKKSQVLQRGLPRPLAPERAVGALQRTAEAGQRGSWRERAEAELAAELAALLQHDAAQYPLKEAGGGEGKKKDKKRDRAAAQAPVLQDFELGELQAASALLKKETEVVRAAMRHAAVPLEEYADTWGSVRRDIIYLPSQAGYGRAASATNSDRLESVRKEHEAAHAEMARAAKRASKLEEKARVVLGGLWGRDAALTASTSDLHTSRLSAQEELACFQALREQEERTVPARLEAMAGLLQRHRAREAALQERYRTLQLRRDDLAQALQALPPLAAQQ